MKYRNNKQKGFVGVLVILIVLALLGVGIFYAVKSGIVKKTKDTAPPTNVVVDDVSKIEEPKLIKVDFLYNVKSITSDTIVLTGKNGDFSLPNDPSVMEVYKGSTKESPKITLATLKVGDGLNMEFVPGKSATLFLLSF